MRTKGSGKCIKGMRKSACNCTGFQIFKIETILHLNKKTPFLMLLTRSAAGFGVIHLGSADSLLKFS